MIDKEACNIHVKLVKGEVHVLCIIDTDFCILETEILVAPIIF